MVESTITSQEMKVIEENAEYLGISKCQLMECAGKAVAENVKLLKKDRECTVYAGVGKNGGDGMVAARHLASSKFRVTLILVGVEKKIVDPNVKFNWEILKRMKNSIKLFTIQDSTLLPEASTPIVIDALLGIGAKGKLSAPILQAVQKINSSTSFCVSIDVPTGIDATTGEKLGDAVKADLTVTFHKPKTGLLKAEKFCGKIVVADVGIPTEAEMYAGPGDVQKTWQTRKLTAHKGDFGRILIVGGSEVYTGAPSLAALAALRTGVDLAYVASPEKTAYLISSYSPNIITLKLQGDFFRKEHIRELTMALENVTALIVGPGLGNRSETVQGVLNLLKIAELKHIPILFDADGLKACSQLNRGLKTKAVFTPHAEEFKILTGETLPETLKEKEKKVRENASRLNSVILLKGSVDIISNGADTKFNWTGNPGMTTGGTGDVLAGIIGGLMAQGIDSFDAAVAGAFINGAAGDSVAAKVGYHIVATDLLNEIPVFLNDPMRHKELLFHKL